MGSGRIMQIIHVNLTGWCTRPMGFRHCVKWQRPGAFVVNVPIWGVFKITTQGKRGPGLGRDNQHGSINQGRSFQQRDGCRGDQPMTSRVITWPIKVARWRQIPWSPSGTFSRTLGRVSSPEGREAVFCSHPDLLSLLFAKWLLGEEKGASYGDFPLRKQMW